MERPYNPRMAVEVLKRLAARYDDARLCMVGPDKDGSAAGVLEAVRAAGLEERFRWTGRLDKEAWIALSRDYDIFINTTDYDTPAVSRLAAMARGLPVGSTDGGGRPRLVSQGEEAWMVPRGDAEAMSARIAWLVEHPAEAEAMARRARARAEAFDWERVRERWIALLEPYCSYRRQS
jgi:glycosyltransferase involved in cell wall biosynthesis